MRTADASAATVDAAAAMVSITRSRRDACSRTGSVGKPFMPDGNLFSLPPIRHASSASVHPLKAKAHHENGQWLRQVRQDRKTGGRGKRGAVRVNNAGR